MPEPTQTPPPSPPPPRRRWVRRLVRPLQWLVNIVALSVLLYVFTPAGNRMRDYITHVDPPARADFIVVLGGSGERAVEGARLYHEGWAPRIIVTSTGKDAFNLADLAAAYGVPREAILIDALATRTADHPHTIAKLPGVDPQTQRFLIVTSYHHTHRSLLVFRHAGYANVAMQAPQWQVRHPEDAPPTVLDRAYHLTDSFSELIKTGIYYVMGWI